MVTQLGLFDDFSHAEQQAVARLSRGLAWLRQALPKWRPDPADEDFADLAIADTLADSPIAAGDRAALGAVLESVVDNDGPSASLSEHTERLTVTGGTLAEWFSPRWLQVLDLLDTAAAMRAQRPDVWQAWVTGQSAAHPMTLGQAHDISREHARQWRLAIHAARRVAVTDEPSLHLRGAGIAATETLVGGVLAGDAL